MKGGRPKRKPALKTFRELLEKYGGNLTNVAKSLKINRKTIYDWAHEDAEFMEAISATRMKLFDECLDTSRVVARGIPRIEGGRIVGWIERPDPSMLRYLMSTLGRKEGFGEAVDLTTGGKPIDSGFRIEVIDRREQIVAPEEEQETE